MSKQRPDMQQLKTFGQILANVSILTVLLKSLWYHAPEMLRYLSEPDWLTAHIVSAVFVAFTFSPAALTWDGKAKERTRPATGATSPWRQYLFYLCSLIQRHWGF